MTTQQLYKVKQTLGFFSMTIAWALMNLLHSNYLAWTNGKADDSGVIIFWSGLFITISWAVFIIFPLNKLDHSKQIFKPLIFPFIAGLYGALTYSIIVGGLFRSLHLVVMFMPLALLTGFIFGVAYSQLIRSDKLVDLLVKQPLAKTIFFLSPAVILFFFFLCIAIDICFQGIWKTYINAVIPHSILTFLIPNFCFSSRYIVPFLKNCTEELSSRLVTPIAFCSIVLGDVVISEQE